MDGAHVAAIESPDPHPEGWFGWPLAAGPHDLLIGAPGEAVDGLDAAGRVYRLDLDEVRAPMDRDARCE